MEIINEFSQLLALRERGKKRTRREFYVMSKDFGKLSYQMIPSPQKRRKGELMVKRCRTCERDFYVPGSTCPYCESTEISLVKSGAKDIGMVCPHCNQILVPNKSPKRGELKALDACDFASQNDGNSRCFYCQEELWQPHVANIGNVKKSKWIRATHYANKTHKGTKTVWVHEDFKDDYFYNVAKEPPLHYLDGEKHKGSRKYAPAEFIKRYLKGYFDIAIFDECQEYKGGFTGQGHAMHALVRASKKQMALTGTIAGGYANHLFYLMWRLIPQRMVEKGYAYTDELKFTEKYGKLEREYAYSGSTDGGDESYLASCKGKQIGTPRTKPGISPLIFMDFLLDQTTFLDLADMSKYLPPLKEYVTTVPMSGDIEKDIEGHYHGVIRSLKKKAREKGNGGMGLLSQMLQFSLSYLDKPYGVPDIISPVSGEVLESLNSYDVFRSIEHLTSKEKKLCELVRSELNEGRNCFIYAEYTGSDTTCVTYRLQQVLEHEIPSLKGKVAVLESASPQASKREEWLKKQAKKGVKVVITNPRCVSTGLDFCFKYEGKQYNYPTLIFYQIGYSLFVIWQASRRHYRLNQTMECRTYYMAWEKSAQAAAIELIAEKQAATSAIQGKFSTEGLASMANGVDARMKLAQSLSALDEQTGNHLQDMFDVLGHEAEDDGRYASYKPMLLLKELIGKEPLPEPNMTFDVMKTGQLDLMDLLSVFNVPESEPVPVETISAIQIAETQSESQTEEQMDTIVPLEMGALEQKENTPVVSVAEQMWDYLYAMQASQPLVAAQASVSVRVVTAETQYAESKKAGKSKYGTVSGQLSLF